MKFCSAIVVAITLAFFSHSVLAEFHIWRFTEDGMPAYNAGSSEADVLRVLQGSTLSTPPPNKWWVKMGECKSTGWFVVVWSNFNEGGRNRYEPAGACGHATEKAAREAAARACRAKPNCARNMASGNMRVSAGFDTGAAKPPAVDERGNPLTYDRDHAGENSKTCGFNEGSQTGECFSRVKGQSQSQIATFSRAEFF